MQGQEEVNYEEDLDQIDLNNYKGCFYEKNAEEKYYDKATGAHFDYFDLCRKLGQVKKRLESQGRVAKKRASVDTRLMATIKHKLDNPRPVSKLSAHKVQAAAAHSRNATTYRTEEKNRQISKYCELAAKLQAKLPAQISDRNKSETLSYALKSKGGKSEKYEALCDMYLLFVRW